MDSENLGPWEPLPVGDVGGLMRAYPKRWWISGGLALELALGRSWRDHEDTDMSILRQDAALLLDVLDGWEIHVAAGGHLRPWDGAPLQAEAHENNPWVRRHADGPWHLDVTISGGDDEAWAYRRDPTFRRAWELAVLRRGDGTPPFLAPDLQLLFKSKAPRSKDHLDAEVVIPELTRGAAALLASRLPRGHPWQHLLI